MSVYNGAAAATIRQSAQSIATEIERSMLRWKYFADKLNTISAADFTTMGLSEDYQTYLGSLRVALENIVLKYQNATPLNSDDPSYLVKLFASMNVI